MDKEKFFNKVMPEPNTGCWIWEGKLDNGYGNIKAFGFRRAHRISYYLYNGDFDKKLHVLHKCDNPSCVNPDHLFLGTNYDNIRDRVKKGRSRDQKGEKHFNVKINESTARTIYSMRKKQGLSRKEVSNTLGIPIGIVDAVTNRHSWKHLQYD